MNDLISSESIQSLIKDILDETKKQGATDAEVDVAMSKGFTVTARKADVESVEYHQDIIVDITVYLNKRSGSASLSDIRPESIKAAVTAACNIARFTDEDPYSGLPEKELIQLNYPQLDLFYPWKISVEEAIRLACECEQKALSQDKRIVNSEGSVVVTSEGIQGYGNTRGFIGLSSGTRHEISCILIAKEKEDMQRDYSYSVAVAPELLHSIDYIAAEAAKRTLRRLGAKRLKTHKSPVIFAAETARSLLGSFVSAISGGNLYRKSSFLLDHLGKQVFPKSIHIQEHPHLPRALGSAAFDDNGIVTRNNVFVDQGVLQSYVLSVYSARKLGMQTTANADGVHNLAVSHGNKNFDELVRAMHKGFVVTELMGQGVNLVNGDYSRGASGFWVEHGEIQYPVEEVTIAGNLKDIFANIVEVGNDVDKRGNIHTGSVLIEKMVIAGD